MILDANSTYALPERGTVRIKVVGVGGAGVNAVRRMTESPVAGVEFLCVNTDLASLAGAEGVKSVVLGARSTRGLGAGGDPEVGRMAVEEAADAIRQELLGADLVFVAAGMGGGTGTGAAPAVAALAREAGAVTVGVVTTPFKFEGTKRKLIALRGLLPLEKCVDTLIVVNNQLLTSSVDRKTSVRDAFAMADQVVTQAILTVSRIINIPGEVNVDFADVRAVLQDGGMGLMGVAQGEGDQRLIKAAKAAMVNPLVDLRPDGAKSLLFFMDAGPDLTLQEVTEAGRYLSELVAPDAQIFFGLHTHQEERQRHEVEVMIIATRLDVDGVITATPEFAEPFRDTVPMLVRDGDLPPYIRVN